MHPARFIRPSSSARVGRREAALDEMTAMKSLRSRCLTMAAALVGTLAATGDAIADDTILTRAAPPALALASAAAITQLEAPPAPPTQPNTDVRQLLSEPAEDARWRQETDSDDPGRAPSVARKSDAKKVPLLTEDILRELGQLPLIETMMVPVTRGVTIETGDGTPALTFAVKPTKITRGSGLVAIGRF